MRNERSFDLLFCDRLNLANSTIFFNPAFAEDPVFNHIVLDDSILEGKSSQENEIFLSELSAAGEELRHYSIRPTLFMEHFWVASKNLLEMAIDSDFRIIEQMNILSKSMREKSEPISAPQSVDVRATSEIEAWNNVFTASYEIPDRWNEELLSREKDIVANQSAILAIASVEEDPSGCILLKEEPEGILGVYCVGTLPEKRGRGVARALLSFSEVHAREIGAETITLQTLVRDNVTPMYLKLGYASEFERNVLQRF